MQIATKVFVVTGGGNGIGREVVLALLARGARVAAADLSEEGLAGTAERAGGRSAQLSTHVVNITDRGVVESLPDQVIAAHGQVDGVINVAGIIHRFARFNELSYDEIEKVLAVNFWGTVNMCKAFLPHLLERPAASLVNVSSMGALVPVPGQSLYGASKAAVKLLSEGLYSEFRGTNIAVTTVFPGGVRTGIAQNSGAAIPGRDASSSKSSNKLTTPEDAARQIVQGVEKSIPRVRIGSDARAIDRLTRLMPRRATDLVANRMKDLLAG